MDGYFATGIACLGGQMLAVSVYQCLRDNCPKPHIGRATFHFREMIDPFGGIDIGILQNILWIDPSEESWIRTKANHSDEPFAELREELRQRRFVTGCEARKQGFGMVSRIRHCTKSARKSEEIRTVCRKQAAVRVRGKSGATDNETPIPTTSFVTLQFQQLTGTQVA